MKHPFSNVLAAFVGCWAVVASAQSIAPEANAAADAPTSAAATDATKPFFVRVKPVLIDTGSTQGSSLGLDYEIRTTYSFSVGDNTSAGEPTFTLDDTNTTIRSGQIELLARGTLASTRQKVPNALLDFSGKTVYKLNMPAFYMRLGGVVGYETDQGFDNRQFTAGLVASASKVSAFKNGDAGSIILSYASVNPAKDEERKALLGSLDNFRRWGAELSYTIPTSKNKLRSIDLNYRRYQETSPAAAIKAAGIDRHQLGLVRANLDQDFFVQYSRGSLPFDARSERAVMVGWSMKLD